LVGDVVIEAEPALRALMLEALKGDARAYSTLMGELSRHLRAYYLRRLGEARDDAEDLVQETLIAMHRRRDSYDPSQPLTAWVYAIARYRLIDHFRRRKVRAAVPLEDAGALFAEDQIEPAMARRDVSRLLDTLPAARAALIRATKIEGMTNAEAGRMAGVSEAAVKVNVHRALKTLAKKAGDSGEDEEAAR
jgi:RNA polymerase sigma factor (sigma-70 family)